jgi:hypothetical protein
LLQGNILKERGGFVKEELNIFDFEQFPAPAAITTFLSIKNIDLGVEKDSL